ncbi:cytochrome P450 [Streptomyces sp. INA 01156]
MDELLRLYSPGTGAARTVVAPAVLGGVELRPGDRLFLGIGSANRDETVFPDPETVDPTAPTRTSTRRSGSVCTAASARTSPRPNWSRWCMPCSAGCRTSPSTARPPRTGR